MFSLEQVLSRWSVEDHERLESMRMCACKLPMSSRQLDSVSRLIDCLFVDECHSRITTSREWAGVSVGFLALTEMTGDGDGPRRSHVQRLTSKFLSRRKTAKTMRYICT